MNSITGRLQAIEDLVRQDGTQEEDSFDYDAFMRNRNKPEQPEEAESSNGLVVQITERLGAELASNELDASIDAPKSTRQRNVIDSDSESDSEGPETALSDAASDQDAHQALSDDEGEVEGDVDATSADIQELSNLQLEKRQPRKSRANAEQQLAHMKRQLDLEVQTYTVLKPTLDDFKTGFLDNAELDAHDESELELVSDTETCPTSPLPFKFTVKKDPRELCMEEIAKFQTEQNEKRQQENMKEYETDEYESDGGGLDDEDDTTKEIAGDTTALVDLPSEPDFAPALDELSGSEADADADADSDTEESTEDVVGTQTSVHGDSTQPIEAHSGTEEDQSDKETQTTGVVANYAATQVADAVDEDELRRLFQKQKKVKYLDDSDSESEKEEPDSEPQESAAYGIPTHAELANLTESQQRAELQRRHQINYEMRLEALEDQAQESEDGDSDLAAETDEDEDDNAPVEGLVDDETKQDVQQEELISKYNELERLKDEQRLKSIRKNVINGDWRSKKLYEEHGMLSDSDEDEQTVARRIKRSKVFHDGTVLGRLASNQKTKAFAESLVADVFRQDTIQDETEGSMPSIQETLNFLNTEDDVDFQHPETEDTQNPSGLAPRQVVSSLRQSTEVGARSLSRDSVVTRPLPSVHSIPVLGSKHIPRARARISGVERKQDNVTFTRMGLHYKNGWK